MPNISIQEIIDHAEPAENYRIMVILVLLFIASVFMIYILEGSFVLAIPVFILLFLIYHHYRRVHFYLWLHTHDVDPARLQCSFVTRPFVEKIWRLDVAIFFSFGIIRADLKRYRLRIEGMNPNLPFNEPIEVLASYSFVKSSFFGYKEDYLCLSREGLVYDSGAIIRWSEILHIEVDIDNKNSKHEYSYIAITNTQGRNYKLDIEDVDTDFVQLEFILKEMHKQFALLPKA